MGFVPWCRSNKSIHESNQVSKFMEAYKQTSCNSENVITWSELPISACLGRIRPLTQHIDGFIIDNDTKTLFFIEAKRLSREERIIQLKEDIDRMFSIRKEIYYGSGTFKGINLFDYNAYVIGLADVWVNGESWKQSVVSDWSSWCGNHVGNIYESPLQSEASNIIDNYFLGYSVFPLFDSKKYNGYIEQLNDPNSERHKAHIAAKQEFKGAGKHKPGEDVSILAWADEIEFESLLSTLNWTENR